MTDLPTDFLQLKKELWPNRRFYGKQEEIIYSVENNKATYVPAANKMGKDYTLGFIIPAAFLTRYPCRIVTTSAKAEHLDVLWGEINSWIQECKYSLDIKNGGPFILNHQLVRRTTLSGKQRCPLSYIKSMVAAPDSIASMGGHHIPPQADGRWRTLFAADECSSVPNAYRSYIAPWANREIYIGNTWECDNFWKKNIEAGDLLAPSSSRLDYYRKIIRIRATDSPNVRWALKEIEAGRVPSGRILLPMKTYEDYIYDLETMDEYEKTVCLNAEFYQGAEIKMYPLEWLMRSYQIYEQLRTSGQRRRARGIGVDTGQGNANTSMYAVDDGGVIEGRSIKTPDTSVIPDLVVNFMQEHRCPASRVCFDRGGGGKEHADLLRKQGYKVRTVAFGESVTADLKASTRRLPVSEALELQEQRYLYLNRRAQMYHELRLAIRDGFGIPSFRLSPSYADLTTQLRAIPLKRDEDGCIFLPPKNRKPDSKDKKPSLSEIIGHSPDELDALVLARYAAMHEDKTIIRAGAVI